MQKKLTEHAPVVNWRNRHIIVSIVGCGGTGSHIATGMPYLHQALLAAGHPYGLRVFLIDGDRITETNCVRQPFSRSEVGLYKAVVLINRLNLFWGLDWEAVPHFVHCGQDFPDSSARNTRTYKLSSKIESCPCIKATAIGKKPSAAR